MLQVALALAGFDRLAPTTWVAYGVAAVEIVGSFHLLMSQVLQLMMPGGLLF